MHTLFEVASRKNADAQHSFNSETGVYSVKVGKVQHDVDTTQLSDEMQFSLMIHGLKQRLGDATAGKVNDAERNERIGAVAANIIAGNWRTPAQEGSTSNTMLLTAILTVMNAAGHTPDEAKIRESVNTSEGRKAWLLNTTVKAEFERVKAEAAAARAAAAAEKAEADEATETDFSEFVVEG